MRTERGLRGVGCERAVPSASVVKAMLLVAYLRRPDVRGRALSAGERALLGPMIRRSDNAAASQVCNIVGTEGSRGSRARVRMRASTRRAVGGCRRIDVARPDALLPAHRPAGAAAPPPLRAALLGSIVPAQRWGIARVRPRGWALYFKGGWGSGTGWADHQVALLRRGERRLSVAILITSSPSHEYGKETLRGIAARLLRGLRPDSRPR